MRECPKIHVDKTKGVMGRQVSTEGGFLCLKSRRARSRCGQSLKGSRNPFDRCMWRIADKHEQTVELATH